MVLTAQLNIVNHIFSHVVKESWCACGLFLTSNIQGGQGGLEIIAARLLHVRVLYVVIPRALLMLLYSYLLLRLLEQLKLLAACRSTTTSTTSSTMHN